MKFKKKRDKIPMRVFYKKEIKKTKIGNIERVIYNFKIAWNDWKKYYVLRFNWTEIMPMVLEAYISKYGYTEWIKLFEDMLEILKDISKKWLNPFWLFTAKYLNHNNNTNDK